MANSNSGPDFKLALSVITTFGLGSIVVVVIGRLWTLSYFSHFGLSTGDLEFTTQDFAFRSLEVFVSLSLAGVGLFVAFSARATLRRVESRLLAGVVVFAAVAFFAFLGRAGGEEWFLKFIVEQASWLTRPVILGFISGVSLILMIFLVATIWFGPSQQQVPPAANVPQAGGAPRSLWAWLKEHANQLVARSLVVGIVLISLPLSEWAGWEVSFPDWASWLTHPGMLGVVSGGALILMIFLVAAIPFEPSRHQVPGAANVPQTGAAPGSLASRIVAVSLMLGIVFIYLPLITQELAELDARLDLRRGNLPVAILETVKDPLPPDIASDDNPKKSNLVRVVLAQKENTYVLDSMRCRTIGEPEVDVETDDDEFIERERDVCKVFAIATRRLESIEYRSVKGNPPENDTPSLAAQVGLREPFEANVSTEDASDDKHIRCLGEERGSFSRTVWYEVTPPSEGVLLVRADSLTKELSPVVGIWRDSGQAIPERDAAPGSGSSEQACEIMTVDVPDEQVSSLRAPEGVQRVATLANLQANETYLIGLGAKKSIEEDRTQGDLHVFIQFFPDGSFLAPKQAGDLPPTIGLPSTLGRVELELRRFDKDNGYSLSPLLDCNGAAAAHDEICVSDGEDGVKELRDHRDETVHFSLEPEEGVEVPFTLVQGDDGDSERTTLEARGLLGAGTWHLKSFQFKTFATLTIPTLQPNLILAFDAPSLLDDPEVRRFLTAVLDLAEIRAELQLEGAVVFDHEFLDAPAPPPQDENDTSISDEEWSALVTFISAHPVDVAAVQQGQQSPEVQRILSNAVKVVQTRLERVGVKVTVGQCTRMCIRIFFIDVQDTAPSQ